MSLCLSSGFSRNHFDRRQIIGHSGIRPPEFNLFRRRVFNKWVFSHSDGLTRARWHNQTLTSGSKMTAACSGVAA